MRARTTNRKIVETAVGAAVGAVIAGPVGAVAGGLAASKAASGLAHLGEKKKPAKKSGRVQKARSFDGTPRRILVPLDFSPSSTAAVRHAAKWAKAFGAEVCLLHVVEPLNTSVPFAAEAVEVSVLPPDFPKRTKLELEKIAKRECGGVAKVSAHIREGVAYDQIVASAEELKADVIVIATHGRSGIMRALMGSTAERVARHATCPVLVVPSSEPRRK